MVWGVEVEKDFNDNKRRKWQIREWRVIARRRS
jgi:hypothetical protein